MSESTFFFQKTTGTHFSHFSLGSHLTEHVFNQLAFDSQMADTFCREIATLGADPLTALERSFTAIAKQRWSRYLAASEQEREVRADEMKMFGSFWYAMAAKVSHTRNLIENASQDQ